MKTVCKKLLCLMLVAIMLVSAVPFAFATETDMVSFWIELWVDDEHKDSKPVSVPLGTDMDEAAVKAYAQEYLYGEYFGDGYTYAGVQEAKVADADNLGAKIFFVTKAVEPETEPTEPETEPTEPETEPTEPETEPTEPAPTTYTLYFHYLNAAKVDTTAAVTGVTSGSKVNTPSIPDVNGLRFDHWNTKADGSGESFSSNTTWYYGMSQDLYAIYDETTDDDVVKLSVWAHFYVEGEYHHRERLFVEEFAKSNDNSMFTWLYRSNDGILATKNALFGGGANSGYQWDPVIFYDYHDNGAITEASMKSNGDKSVYVKVYSQDAIQASVYLYVHTAKKAAVDRVIPMPGYTAGDHVTLAAAKEAVKTKYKTTNKTTFSDLYTQSEWEDLLDGMASSGAASVEVEDNGTTKIHIIVKNATSGGSNADPSNPKTGDNIMIAVGTMALAGAALVAVIELKKRKMI